LAQTTDLTSRRWGVSEEESEPRAPWPEGREPRAAARGGLSCASVVVGEGTHTQALPPERRDGTVSV
jgi:hypothetical protein